MSDFGRVPKWCGPLNKVFSAWNFRKHGGGDVHFRTAQLAAAEGLLVRAPMLDLPVLVDMGERPGAVGVDDVLGERQRQQRRAGERRHRVQAGERQWIAEGGKRGGKSLDRRG